MFRHAKVPNSTLPRPRVASHTLVNPGVFQVCLDDLVTSAAPGLSSEQQRGDALCSASVAISKEWKVHRD